MVRWAVAGVVNPREVREDPVGRRVVARHRITRKPLAITYLSPELLADAEFRARFARDITELARVREARVARVHRYLESRHGAAVIADHVSGTPLRSLLLTQGALAIEAALVVLRDSLLALAACDEVGMAHGDIKPENVILTPTGRIRLVDFGLWTSDGRRLLSRSTPFYLAPEQWSARCATQAGDVYAAMATFFECLVGAPPFYADGVTELSAKHERSAAPVEVVPEPVRELVLRGLAKDPRSRPEARSLLAHVDDVAARAAGSGWERCGRRELQALLADRSALPDVSALVRRSGGAGWEQRRPVRMAAVLGGALALAAGLSSPPLAVTLPGFSIFGSDGRPPVLAFPEPNRDTVSVRVVTNGPLAGRALTPAKKAGAAGPVAGARPPAPSVPGPDFHTASGYATPDAVPQSSSHPESANQGEITPDQSTPASQGCTQQLFSDPKPCTAVNPEQSTPGSAATTSDSSQVSIPVSLPVQLPLLVEVPVQLPVPVQSPQSILIRTKIQPARDIHIPKSTRIQTGSPESAEKARIGPPDTDAKGATQPTNRPQDSAGNSGNSGIR